MKRRKRARPPKGHIAVLMAAAAAAAAVGATAIVGSLNQHGGVVAAFSLDVHGPVVPFRGGCIQQRHRRPQPTVPWCLHRGRRSRVIGAAMEGIGGNGGTPSPRWRARGLFSEPRAAVSSRAPSLAPSSSLRMGRATTEGDGGRDGEENRDGDEGMDVGEEGVFDMKGTFHEDDVQYEYGFFTSPSEDEDDDDDDDDDEVLAPSPPQSSLGGWDDLDPLSREEVEKFTVSQLKQQLRLRNLKVSGRKSELVSRLVGSMRGPETDETDAAESSRGDDGGGGDDDAAAPLIEVVPESSTESNNRRRRGRKKTKAQILSEKHGKEFVDVSAYVEEEIEPKNKGDDDYDNEEVEGSEVWGAEAKIVQEMENPVVDNISRTVVEFVGANRDRVKAYVCATREALKSYLSGGRRGHDPRSPARRVAEIQRRRERADKVPGKLEGADDPNHKGFYYVEDYSDVGLYTMTGAKISASEVEGVLFLSDVRGPHSPDCRALCEKIAFECQPCVVMAPDLFRDHPWIEDDQNLGHNADGRDYEEWREVHASPEGRVHADIRAAAAVLRERYGVSSVVVFGTCFGGGRALEAASAGWTPADFDLDLATSGEGGTPPPPVDPSACIAWYPTRYDAPALFGEGAAAAAAATVAGTATEEGSASSGSSTTDGGVAVMAIFAGDDVIPGATPADAETLRTLLNLDTRVKDVMVKVFPGQPHGFAHVGLGGGGGGDEGGDAGGGVIGGADGEVAALLSTAWMETYSRVFLPTGGEKVMEDEEWGAGGRLEMKDTSNLPPYQPKEDEWATFDFESVIEGSNFEDHNYDGEEEVGNASDEKKVIKNNDARRRIK